ncbi:MAG TPA: T3SS effector HopA1 family protein, partial [Roseiflexaceae bacterium]|nr:T3SS effector HopA1 family protein [Roseiflexaceae bacterium]
MNDYRRHVEAAIQATVFHSATRFSWFGRRSHPLPSTISRALTPTAARAYMLFALQSRLYSDFYCRGFAAPTANASGGSSLGWLPFVDALSAANTGRGYWEDGWQIAALSGDDIVAFKAGLAVRAKSEACVIAPGDSVAPGARLRLLYPKEFRRRLPGFYLVLSDRQLIDEDAQPLVRLYWNLTAEGAASFVQHATSLLNRADLPFRLKVLNDPAQYTRCDAGVIYLFKHDYAIARALLESIYQQVAASLKPTTPVFTKPLAPGLGLAEDPGHPDSFGLQRCRILADGLIRAYEQGKTSAGRRWQVVAEHFAEQQIDLHAPFLNPGSADIYDFQATGQIFSVLQAPAGPASDRNTSAYLKTADEIGQRLVREAVWHVERCNWLGAETNISTPAHGHSRATYRALGPELYHGSSGVALFLAQLFGSTGDLAVRRTALGGIWQALERAEAVELHRRLGLYTGWAGLALAAARLGCLLGEEALLDRARQLVYSAASAGGDLHEFDLLAGSAGTIAGLVALRGILEAPLCLDFAARLADELIQAADKSSAGYSWASPGLPAGSRLTGFSHGAAGIGYALLELFQATGASRYREAAIEAFEYERYWFDDSAGNWPDFRHMPATRRDKRPRIFATHWCHGAPGIAVSRLRAYQLTADELCKTEAITGLDTTRAALEQA